MDGRTAMTAKAANDLERAIDGLYAQPLDGFIAARNALAASMKKAGRADAAARVKALAKPSLTAWVVNQVYWHDRAAFDALLAAGDRARAAEGALLAGRAAGADRDAVRVRTAALDRLAAIGARRAADAGQPLSAALALRLRTTLDAIAAWGTADPRHEHGRLLADVDPPGFGVLAALAPAAGSTAPRGAKSAKPAAPARPPAPPPVPLRPRGGDEARLARARQEVERAEQAHARARAEQDRRQAAADGLRRREEEAEARVREQERKLDEAREARRQAAADRRAADREAQDAGAAAAASGRALDSARAALAAAERTRG